MARLAGPALATLFCVTAAACGMDVRSEAGSSPPPSAPVGVPAEAVFPELPPDVTKAKGVDGQREAEANRALRAELPELPGAQLVDVTDHWVLDEVSEPGWAGNSTDRTVAVGVETTWRYRLDSASKCQVADAFEGPIAAAGWTQFTLETAGPGGVGAIRLSDFTKPDAHVIVNVDAPPTDFNIRVQAHRKTQPAATPPIASPFMPCQPDRPPPPPDRPVDKAAALAANQSIYAKLPIPPGATLVEKTPEAATAMGNGNVAIGYGTGWRLRLPAGTDLCAAASAFEAAMAKAGWERFTDQSTVGRESRFYQPPRSVEATIMPGGELYVLVMNNGAVVGTRQYPTGNQFTAGATPESRGQPVPCSL
jgi:hypothetical protein